jgi:DNA primase large subunit
LKLGVEDLAKYPFLEEAGDYFRQRGFSLNDISQPDFEIVIERAKNRVLDAIHRREVSSNIGDPEVELLSFPVALMMVKATGLDHLVSWFSHTEAVRTEKLLENEREELVVQIFKHILKINLVAVTADDNDGASDLHTFDYKIPLMEYLKRASQFHQLEWKLVNRVVSNGYVYLRTHEMIRLIRQEIDGMIRARLNTLPVPRLPSNLKAIVKDLAARSPAPPKIVSIIAPDKYPPCVTTAQAMLEKGENLPHYARFLLTTYLVAAGRTVDEIIQMYSGSPDFNERITKYQVEHIAGLRGGRVKYRPPSCRTLATHSFCFKVKECNDIRNPLQFGTKRFTKNPDASKKKTKEKTKKQ